MSPLFKVDDAHEFKPLLAEIEDSPVSPLGRIIFWTVVAVMLFFVVWTIVGQVDIVVSARGKVIPDGRVKILQPLDTGVVRKIVVKEGDLVKRGQTLMEIDPSVIQPEVESNRKNLSHTRLEIERLQSVLTGRAFQPDPRRYDADALDAQTSLHQAAVTALNSQLDAKRNELNKIGEQVKSSEVDRSQNQEMLEVSLGKEFRLSRVQDIIPKDEYEKVTSDILTYRNQVQQAEHKLKELGHQRLLVMDETSHLQHEFQKANLQELSDKQKAATELEAKLMETSFKSAKQRIVSPVDGCVDTLFVHTIGGVVTPAEKLMSVVPGGTPVVVEALVLNKDIGFVSQGMPVAIKVDTFDFQKYGMFDGKVRLVSRDSREEKESGLIFPVFVTPTTPHLNIEGKRRGLEPGMTVTAEVKVGKRRIIEFFIYPLIKYLHEGMSVR